MNKRGNTSSNEQYKQVIGVIGAEAIDKANGNTKLMDNFHRAMHMTRAGRSPKDIRIATGWELGVDGSWKYEIMDGVLLNPNGKDKLLLGELYENQDLYRAYPQLASTDVAFDIEYDLFGYSGLYDPDTNTIHLRENYKSTIEFALKQADDNSYWQEQFNKAKSTLLHEIQHAVQYIEGFAVGANFHTFDRRGPYRHYIVQTLPHYIERRAEYRHTAGEVEARNVQSRMNMSPEERRNTLLADTADKKQEEQLVFHNNDELNNSNDENIRHPEEDYFLDEDANAYLDSLDNDNDVLEYSDTDYDYDMAHFDDIADAHLDALDNDGFNEIYRQSATDNSNMARSADDFLTPEAKRQVALIRAKYQGTPQWLKAPNGEDTNLTELQWLLVRTPNFKKWFGDWEFDPDNASKIVDFNGEPRIVYHGSPEGEFSVFKTGGGSSKTDNTGAWFTSNIQTAKTYFNAFEEHSLYPVFLNIRNPYIYHAGGRFWDELGTVSIINRNDDTTITADKNGNPFSSMLEAEDYIRYNFNGNERNYYAEVSNPTTTDNIVREVKFRNKNFDGIIFKDILDTSEGQSDDDDFYNEFSFEDDFIGDDFVVFLPNNIKSATRNNGEYSLSNNEIYKQVIGETGARAIDKANNNTNLMDKFRLAQQMKQRGIKPRTIKRSTGWELGIEGKWKFELQDGQLRNPDAKQTLPLREFYDNPELFYAYPMLNDINVAFDIENELFTPAVFNPETIGYYDKKNKTIHLQSIARRYFSYIQNLPENDYRHEEIKDIKAWLVSQIQQLIQPIEGFALSRSQRWFKKRRVVQKIDENGNTYNAIAPSFPAVASEFTAGKTEAVNIGKRADFTPEQRKNSLLADTEDLARERQLIIQNRKKKRDFDAWADDYANAKFDALDSNSETYHQSARNKNSDNNNTVRSVYDFLTPAARKQVRLLKTRYQGTAQWLKAPNGKNTNLDELQWLLVRTSNFKKWFGDWQNNPSSASKILDENGEPRIVYHGTDSDFSVFDISKLGSSSGDIGYFGKGFYFAFSPDEAEFYGWRVMPAFVNIRNPFYFQEQLQSFEGSHKRDFETDNAVFILNLVDKLPELAEGQYIKRDLSFKDFAHMLMDVIQNKSFKVIEHPVHKGTFKIVADPYPKVYDDGNGHTHNYTEYNFETYYLFSQEQAQDKVTQAVKYLYSKINLPSDLIHIHQFIQSVDFNSALTSRGYDGVMQSKFGDEVAAFYREQIKSASRNNGDYSPNPDIYKQIIGEIGADAIDFANHNNNLMDNLNTAKDMTRQGKSPAEIRRRTGWEKGHDGKWRYEIKYGNLIHSALNNTKDTFTLSELWDAPELFNAYDGLFLPNSRKGLASMLVQFNNLDNIYGIFDPSTFSISIDRSLRNNPKELRSTLVHEIQHAIQHVEGFAAGGNNSTGKKLQRMANIWYIRNYFEDTAQEHPELAGKRELVDIVKQEYEKDCKFTGEQMPPDYDFELGFSLYLYGDRNGAYQNAYNILNQTGFAALDNGTETAKRLAGETEARNAERRMDWTDEQRINNTLASSEDVDADEQIIIEHYAQSANNNDDISSVSDIPAKQLKAVRKKYKGTSMWLKAPNGKKSNLTGKQWLQVRTPNFKAWFGDWENDPDNASQVIDENGEPLVLYHRTQRGNNFSVFRKNSGGIHFGTRRQADDRAKGRLFPVFLNVRNPFRMYDQGAHWNFSADWTERTGNDGIVYLNEVEGVEPGTAPQDSWIVFEPNQIKSATKNNGYFDSNNPDIYKQTANDEQQPFYGIDADGRQLLLRFNTPEIDAIYEKHKKAGTLFLAPNGKKSNLPERAWLLARTPAFKQWFGDWENNPQEASKVIDENGEPLIVVHFTDEGGFSVFDTSGKFGIDPYKTKNTGAWFADLKDNEPTYSDDKEGENIYHVFLNIRNPFIYDAEERQWNDIGRIWIADEDSGEPIYYDKDGKPFLYDYQAREYIRTVLRSNPRYYWEHDSRYPTTDDLVRAVRRGKLGSGYHDGVIIRNVGDLGYDNIDDYIIFKPIQVKSRDNNGAFSNYNTEIYKQVIGEKGAQAIDRVNGNTALMDNLKLAKSMAQSGRNPKEIKIDTGWELGHYDKKWRYEIPDGDIITNAKFKWYEIEAEKIGIINFPKIAYWKATLADIFDAPILYRAYPELKNIEVSSTCQML